MKQRIRTLARFVDLPTPLTPQKVMVYGRLVTVCHNKHYQEHGIFLAQIHRNNLYHSLEVAIKYHA